MGCAPLGPRCTPLLPPPSLNTLAGPLYPFSPARTLSVSFQAAGRRCGRSPLLLAAQLGGPHAGPSVLEPGPRSAGPPQAMARPVTEGGLEFFQAGTGFRLLDFEMSIYHHN